MFLKFLEILTCICIGKFLNFKEIKNDISINIININIDKDFDFDFDFIFNYLGISYELITEEELCLSLFEKKDIIINKDLENIQDYIPICNKYINNLDNFYMNMNINIIISILIILSCFKYFKIIKI
tara:strand:+ start:54 stop:434 length:381 start_codon:yes stop_codon:yes gene_type:complete